MIENSRDLIDKLIAELGRANAISEVHRAVLVEIVRELKRRAPDGDTFLADLAARLTARTDAATGSPDETELRSLLAELNVT